MKLVCSSTSSAIHQSGYHSSQDYQTLIRMFIYRSVLNIQFRLGWQIPLVSLIMMPQTLMGVNDNRNITGVLKKNKDTQYNIGSVYNDSLSQYIKESKQDINCFGRCSLTNQKTVKCNILFCSQGESFIFVNYVRLPNRIYYKFILTFTT